MSIYRYDGKMVIWSYIFDAPEIQSILSELDAVNATKTDKWSSDDITLPIYGLNIGATDGWGIFAAWSNGYWITQTGEAYKFDFDFAELAQKYPGDNVREFPDSSVMPCAYYLAQDENGWSSALLTPAREPNPPDFLTMALAVWHEDTVTVTIANNSDDDWGLGEYFSLDVQLDGAWYRIPTVPGNWGFNDIGYALQGGKSQEMTYHLAMYGDLPDGVYRLIAYELSVEHTISRNITA